jgi:hypothetical protein
MRLLRLSVITVLVAGLLGAGYFWAYKTSSMGWVSSTKRPVMRIMGMNLDYTEKNCRRYTAVFRPLIDRDYRNSVAKQLEGTFTGLSSSGGLNISRPGKMGILVQYGAEHKAAVKDLPKGTEVRISYKLKSLPDNPFSYQYYLTELNVLD